MTPGNFARSTNFGASFTTTKTFSGQTLPGMMVAVGPNVWNGNNISGGCVYVVTHGGTNSAGIYTFHVSTDGGLTFTQKSQQMYSGVIGTEIGGRSTVNGMRTRPYPMIAADNSWGPNRGRLYLVYATNDPQEAETSQMYFVVIQPTWELPGAQHLELMMILIQPLTTHIFLLYGAIKKQEDCSLSSMIPAVVLPATAWMSMQLIQMMVV
jgi:hypothetical protein